MSTFRDLKTPSGRDPVIVLHDIRNFVAMAASPFRDAYDQYEDFHDLLRRQGKLTIEEIDGLLALVQGTEQQSTDSAEKAVVGELPGQDAGLAVEPEVCVDQADVVAAVPERALDGDHGEDSTADEPEITTEIIAHLRECLGKSGLEFFAELKQEYGDVSPIITEYRGEPLGIPHHVHFREGMRIRNYLRDVCDWDQETLDNNWARAVEAAIAEGKL